MLIQLVGNVCNGGLFEVGFGVMLGELVDGIGGGIVSGWLVCVVQVGGLFGVYFLLMMFDLLFDYEVFVVVGGLIGYVGVMVFDDGVDMVYMVCFVLEFCVVESCGKCMFCCIGLICGVEIIDKIIVGKEVGKNIVLLNLLCDIMFNGLFCVFGGMVFYFVVLVFKYFFEDFGIDKIVVV